MKAWAESKFFTMWRSSRKKESKRTEQLSVDLDWTNCGLCKQYWDEFKEDISKQKSTLDTEIENIVEANEIEKYKREKTLRWLALKKILYWQKNLHEKRMKFIIHNSTEDRERKSKWEAFKDHMCTLIETNTV